ncbi:MAG: LuxR family transcriptional regulator [Paracoccaceae bacterium]|nr:LuxR family transcriptional regulator [Paracoccaceae bacterium]
MLGLLERMIAAQTIDEVWTCYLKGLEALGFAKAMYGLVNFHPKLPSFASFEDILFLSNHDKAYLDIFIGEELYKDAPMVKWAAENAGAASWRQVAAMYEAGTLSEAEMRVIQFNRRMGVIAGYSISFRGLSVRSKGTLGLVGAPGLTQDDVDGIWDEQGQKIMTLSSLLHLKATNLPRDLPYSLTERQREALEWVAEGKTTQDIALLMDISIAMVEKHLRLARDAMDVETTAHAVAKASRLNQIFSSRG